MSAFHKLLTPTARLFWIPSLLNVERNSWFKEGIEHYEVVDPEGRIKVYMQHTFRPSSRGALEIMWSRIGDNPTSPSESPTMVNTCIQEILLNYLKEPYLSQYKEELVSSL